MVWMKKSSANTAASDFLFQKSNHFSKVDTNINFQKEHKCCTAPAKCRGLVLKCINALIRQEFYVDFVQDNEIYKNLSIFVTF